MPNQKRQTAYKIKIKNLINGKYVKEEGWQPNYIITDNGKEVSRINLIGTVISKENEPTYQSMMIDDGSGKIAVRSFENNGILDNVDIGDVVLLVGRPREFNSEKYIIPEILKKTNQKLIQIRELELKKQRLKEEPEEEKAEEVAAGGSKETQKIYDMIKLFDKGDGADVDDLIKKASIIDVDLLIKNLLEKGEIFELKPGRLKVLE